MHYIAVKFPGAKKSVLYAGRGRTSPLRIYAIRYTEPLEKIQALCDELASQNPGVEFKPKVIPKNRDMNRASEAIPNAQ